MRKHTVMGVYAPPARLAWPVRLVLAGLAISALIGLGLWLDPLFRWALGL